MRYSGSSVSVQAANNWLRFGENNKNFDTKMPDLVFKHDLSDLPKKISQLSPQQKQIVYDLVDAILGNN